MGGYCTDKVINIRDRLVSGADARDNVSRPDTRLPIDAGMKTASLPPQVMRSVFFEYLWSLMSALIDGL